MPSFSRSGQSRVDGLVPVGGRAMRRWDGQAVQDGGGVGSARGMEIGVLVDAGRVAWVRVVVVGTLQVCVVALGAGERGGGCGGGHRGSTRLAAVVSVVGARGGAARRLAVVARAELLRLDVRPLLPSFTGRRRRGGRALVSPRLGSSTTAATGRRGIGGPVRPHRRILPVVGRHGRVTVEGQVLVKLVDVEGLHVADDLAAQLGDVHVAEVDVLPTAFRQATALVLQLLLAPVVKVRLGGRGRGGGSVSLTCSQNTFQDLQNAGRQQGEKPPQRFRNQNGAPPNRTGFTFPEAHRIHRSFLLEQTCEKVASPPPPKGVLRGSGVSPPEDPEPSKTAQPCRAAPQSSTCNNFGQCGGHS